MFYRVLDCIYVRCGTQDIVIANVDLNVMSENEQDSLNKVVGTYGLGERNERSDLWVEMMFVKRSSDNNQVHGANITTDTYMTMASGSYVEC